MIAIKSFLLMSSLTLLCACTPTKQAPTTSLPNPAALSFEAFCTQQHGQLRQDMYTGLAVCMTEQGVCSGTDYAEKGCANLNQCVQEPANCERRVPPLSPSFCPEGERVANRDACDCRQGMLCLKKL